MQVTQIVVLIIVLLLCGGAYFYMKYMERRKTQAQNAEHNREAQNLVTAQQFINVKDVVDTFLYTKDDRIFCFIQLEGLCLELYSSAEQVNISRNLAASLSRLRYPFKYLAVSRPLDISNALQEYGELYAGAEGGRRKILMEDQSHLTQMVVDGDTLDRQHYIVLWSHESEAKKELLERAKELARNFREERIGSEVLKRNQIVKLCNLVNIPAYVHLEDTKDLDTLITVLKGNAS